MVGDTMVGTYYINNYPDIVVDIFLNFVGSFHRQNFNLCTNLKKVFKWKQFSGGQIRPALNQNPGGKVFPETCFFATT